MNEKSVAMLSRDGFHTPVKGYACYCMVIYVLRRKIDDKLNYRMVTQT